MNLDLIQTFEVEISPDELQTAIRRKIGNNDARAPKGFRGAEYMPLSYILKKFGEEFLSDVLRELLTRRVNAEIFLKSWDVAGTQVTGKWSMQDRPLRYKYDITLELYPTFEVKGLDKLQLRAPARTLVDDSHIDAALEVLRRGHSTWQTVDRPSVTGDRVTVNFYSMLADGSPFHGGKGENVGIELGSGGMLPKFEEQLTGVIAGQHLDFPVVFPPDYGTPVLAGQTAFFSVTVLSVAQFDLVPLDDTFPEKCGVQGGMAELREVTRVHLQRQHDEQDQRDVDSDLLRQLTMANVVSLPPSLVVQQLSALQVEAALQRGVSPEQVQNDEGLIEQAQYRVHMSVIVRQLIKQEKLQFSNDHDLTEQVVEWLKKRAAQNGETFPS